MEAHKQSGGYCSVLHPRNSCQSKPVNWQLTSFLLSSPFFCVLLFLFAALLPLPPSLAQDAAISTCQGLYNAIQSANSGGNAILYIATSASIRVSDCVGISAIPGFNGLTGFPQISTSITIIGLAPSTPTISGGGLYPILNSRPTSSSLNVTLTNLKLIQGKSSTTYGDGPCLQLAGSSSAVLTNVSFQGCSSATSSGALFLDSGSLTLNSCSFSSNSACSSASDTYAGALSVNPQAQVGNRALVINSCSFDNNTAQACACCYSAMGGAIWTNIPTIVTSSSFTSNTAMSSYSSSRAGAIFSVNQPLTISSSTFAGNSASSNVASSAGGGAVSVASQSGQNVLISDSNFTGNVASGGEARGGAIQVRLGPFLVNNCRFTANSASASPRSAAGGAVDSTLDTQGGVSSITDSIFANNNATTDLGNVKGGAISYGGNNAGTLQLYRSVFSGNMAKSAGGVAYGGAVSVGLGSNPSASISSCYYDGSLAQGGSGAYGGALFFDKQSVNTFCRSSEFSALAPNQALNGSAPGLGDDVAGPGAAVKFCHEIPVSVSPSYLLPVPSCDSCSCSSPSVNPCDPRAACSMLTSPNSNGPSFPVCACPVGMGGNGFLCGGISVCTIT